MEKILNAKEKEETKVAYSYYSKILNKPFDTVDALVKAETEMKEAEAKKEAETLAKRNAANIVNNAIDVYEEGKVNLNEVVANAYNEYKAKVTEAEKSLAVLEKDATEKLNKWLSEHPDQGFHYTYKSKDGRVVRDYTYYNNRHNVLDNAEKVMRLLQDLWFK